MTLLKEEQGESSSNEFSESTRAFFLLERKLSKVRRLGEKRHVLTKLFFFFFAHGLALKREITEREKKIV